MLSRDEITRIRKGLLEALKRGPQASSMLAGKVGCSRSDAANQLKCLRVAGLVAHSGGNVPVWRLVMKEASDDDFKPTAPVNISHLMAKQWRGTPWQGLEAVL